MDFSTLYTELKTTIAPIADKAVTITKDYAFDIFGRYVKYLLIVDSLLLIFCLVLLLVYILNIRRTHNLLGSIDKLCSDHNQWVIYLVYIAIVPAIFFLVLQVFQSINSVIKDIFIPEIRIYQIYSWK